MPVDLKKSRRVIAASLLTNGACLSKPYQTTAGATLVDVMTERDGAKSLEFALPQTGRAVVAAFGSGGWADALDEVEHLRKQVDQLRKQQAALTAHVRKFITDQQITGPESVAQCDRVIENAYAFIEGCGEIVGWYRYPEDE